MTDPHSLQDVRLPYTERDVLTAAIGMLKFYEFILGGRPGTNEVLRRWLILRGTEIVEQKL